MTITTQSQLTVTTKLPKLTFYLPEELKKDLELLAKSQRRSVSNLLVVLSEEAVNKAKAEGKI